MCERGADSLQQMREERSNYAVTVAVPHGVPSRRKSPVKPSQQAPPSAQGFLTKHSPLFSRLAITLSCEHRENFKLFASPEDRNGRKFVKIGTKLARNRSASVQRQQTRPNRKTRSSAVWAWSRRQSSEQQGWGEPVTPSHESFLNPRRTLALDVCRIHDEVPDRVVPGHAPRGVGGALGISVGRVKGEIHRPA